MLMDYCIEITNCSEPQPGLSLKKCRGGGGQPDYSLWTSAAAVLNCISHTCCRYRHGCAHVANPALPAFVSSIQAIPRLWREAFSAPTCSGLPALLPTGTSLGSGSFSIYPFSLAHTKNMRRTRTVFLTVGSALLAIGKL